MNTITWQERSPAPEPIVTPRPGQVWRHTPTGCRFLLAGTGLVANGLSSFGLVNLSTGGTYTEFFSIQVDDVFGENRASFELVERTDITLHVP